MGRFPKDTLHGVQKGNTLHCCQIVQRICAADTTRPPAPFSIGDFQAVVGAGGIGISADMYQLLRIKAAQVGQQVHLAGGGDLVF